MRRSYWSLYQQTRKQSYNIVERQAGEELMEEVLVHVRQIIDSWLLDKYLGIFKRQLVDYLEHTSGRRRDLHYNI